MNLLFIIEAMYASYTCVCFKCFSTTSWHIHLVIGAGSHARKTIRLVLRGFDQALKLAK